MEMSMEQLKKEVQDLAYTIEAVREQAAETYGLAKMGKRLGLEGKSKAILGATFVIDRKLDRLAKLVGADLRHNAYVNRSLEAEDEFISNLVELAITSYDGEITELVEQVGVRAERVEVAEPKKVEAEPVQKPVQAQEMPESPKMETSIQEKPVNFGKSDEAEETIASAAEFGEKADMSALTRFIG